MNPIDYIVGIILNIATFFLGIYLEVKDWVFPFNLIAPFFLDIWFALVDIAVFVRALGDWIENIYVIIADFLTSGEIWDFFRQWFEWAEWAWNWVSDAFGNVWDIITSWWSTTQLTVIGWIDTAIAGVEALLGVVESGLASLQTSWDDFWTITWPQWMSAFTDLASAWDNFWVNIFPTLATWSGVSDLIETALKEWFPWYDDLVKIIDEVFAFFANPLDYLVDKLETWFWGY